MSGFTIAKLAKQSTIYWAATMLSKLIGFILIPFYTRYLTPSDYGVMELLVLTVDVISLLIGLQLIHSISKYYHAETSIKEKNSVVSTALIIVMVIAIAGFGILNIYSGWFATNILDDVNKKSYFTVVFVASIFGIINNIPLLYLRITEKSTKFIAIVLFQLFFTVSLTIYLVAVEGMSVFGVILSNAIISGVVFLYLIVDLIRAIGIRFSEIIAKKLFLYSLPLVPGVIGMFIINSSDRYFLKVYTTIDQVGIYAVAYKFGYLINSLIIGPFNMVWAPKMFEFFGKPDQEKVVNKIFLWITFILVVVALLISLYIKEALMIMTPLKFHSAGNVVPLLLFAYVLNGMNRLVYSPLYVEKSTMAIGIINMFAAILCLLLNFTLIPLFGIYGAAVSTIIAFGSILLLGVAVTRYKKLMRWEFRGIIRIFLLAFTCGILGEFINTRFLFFEIVMKTLLFFIFLYAVYYTEIFERCDLDNLFKRARNIFSWNPLK